MNSYRHALMSFAVVASVAACASESEGSGESDGTAELGIAAGEWPAYGRTAGGARYSPLDQITRNNVARLTPAWTSHTGDVSDGTVIPRRSSFQATPIHVFGNLFLVTPFNRVIALDPDTGQQRWVYDPQIDKTLDYGHGFAARGVSAWSDPWAPPWKRCRRRIVYGTADARLIALDASSGIPCSDFGSHGVVDLAQDIGPVQRGRYGVTSPPAIVGDVVIVGSSIGDNRGIDLERGTVRGFHARTGALLWSWDPIPRDPQSPGHADWDPAAAARTRAANVWTLISADPARDLVFLPTGSAAPDYYGGDRLGKNPHANSIVALRASTGAFVWAFQLVHHDLWDYDAQAQPALTTIQRAGRDIPVVVVATKLGHVFVLHRETGQPVFPVEERPVPPSDVPGEAAWPTQPFPTITPNLVGSTMLTPDDAWGLTPNDRAGCRARLEQARNHGLFTPVAIGRETIQYPSALGGTNWGGVAIDPARGVMVTAVNRLASTVQLVPRDEFDPADPRWAGAQIGEQRDTPYVVVRHNGFVSPSGVPCTAPPWGQFVAVDLATGQIKWRSVLGKIPGLAGIPGADTWGSISLGGPITTAGGLAFIGAAMDNAIRAFDVDTGRELWRGELPAGGQATPMTYRSAASGRQFVVIAAGGHAGLGTTLGDSVVAFALPDQ